MSTFMVDQTVMFQWYTLINEARKASLINLTEEVESYLVFLLMRFANKPEIAKSVLSTEYLEGLSRHVQRRQTVLQEVGDKCLLMAGLFPARAERKRVKISYFVRLGQNAYTISAELSSQKSKAVLYHTLSEQFVPMMDVLQTTRELDQQKDGQLTPLAAYELWSDTHSAHALKILRQYTDASLIEETNAKKQH